MCIIISNRIDVDSERRLNLNDKKRTGGQVKQLIVRRGREGREGQRVTCIYRCLKYPFLFVLVKGKE
jgi:hypothetical protein